jgi:hypothetical protein
MKKFAFVTLLALALAICSCGHTIPTAITNTEANGNWEAELTPSAGMNGLSFVTTFSVIDTAPLDITAFGFINSGPCFATGLDQEPVSGSASFGTNTGTGQVTGTLTYIVHSSVPPGNLLTLNGQLSGTSNGTTTTTGTLSNGVVWGTWTLTNGPETPQCTGTGNFIMCQGTATCSIP